ncbi:chaperone protein SicA [Pectobacterium brasiliense]|uniref:type III secretion system translocator chaperone SicA n=1 Tax=Pectobacterium brasiliense TaxID=180957 RepID=UPI0004E67B44|nr:type III secretion system translocator chaperone SicA [Pectobacterium brasiliense]KFF67194.1 chaperone protein SicA [Pectobacterium brasiliense]
MINENTINIPDDDDEVYDYSIGIIDAIQSGATLKDVHNVSHETMGDIYKLAYDFYLQGKLNDAESLFRFLCIYDFYNPEYAMGLAAVYQLKKNYPKAIDFYALSYSLSENDYRPMFYAGQCNLMLRHVVQAKKCFEIVIDRCSDPMLNEKSQNYLLALSEMNNDGEVADSDK